MSFDSLGLSAELLRSIKDQGYTKATSIQEKAIPAALQGKDLMASAQTGTGKTAAFTLPMLQKIAAQADGGRRHIKALVLAPTRELAAQVEDSVRTYGRHLKLRSLSVCGGAGIGPQIRQMNSGVDILVATPGRLMDHMERGTVDLSGVETLILDEADRMLDMGFFPAIEKIVKTLPKSRQTLLFSATFSAPIQKLARNFMNSPELIETAARNSAGEQIDQSAYMVDSNRKRELLTHLIGTENWGQVLVFTRTKRGADQLAKQLEQDGIRSTAIHGDKSQGARTKALKQFKQNSVRALIATDVAARGIDIDRLDYVVNYDMPDNPDDYVHRIGRTGRGGEQGSAISLVSGHEKGQFASIRKVVKKEIPSSTVQGFEPQQRPRQGPRPGNGNGNRQGGRRSFQR
ncbi:ATP-dependent RNA helicase RhlE [Halospina denitrificans]|uniref:DEAD-box ATP-dependent RNA helicase RhpA n=1 Tax=Halospina denitrificans TaxID=332522 RepID=A0A4V3ER40_9GAMM|nr:DEAD/DEAH box helicase [Halospina denitrificans]TDT43128.1 ATP-dependent RNA helicase RhlE [Halospina denitrificans]